jgi:hypothetical protein
LAQDCFENAIKLYGLNFQYYLNIVNCYKAQGLASSKIASLQVSPNIYDRIKLGILYIEMGETRRGVNLLDEISMANPDLLITPAIRQYISKVIKEKL